MVVNGLSLDYWSDKTLFSRSWQFWRPLILLASQLARRPIGRHLGSLRREPNSETGRLSYHTHTASPITSLASPCRYPAAVQKERPLGVLSLSWNALLPLRAWTQIPRQQAAQCSAQTHRPMMQCCQHQRPPQQTRRTWVLMNWSCWPNWRSRTGIVTVVKSKTKHGAIQRQHQTMQTNDISV